MAGLQVVSYGGGVQSTALLVLAAHGRIDFRVFLFANVGADSEDPATLAYLETYAKPYAAEHKIELHELRRVRRDGSTETLYGRLTKPGSRSLPIPVRMSNGAPGTRSCTADFKIKVIGRWLKTHGASSAAPATVGIGISLDEIERVNNRRAMPYERPVYPLLDHQPPLRRIDCQRIISAAGLPIPPKSACWFCPMRRSATWSTMRRDRPALFARACDLETQLNERRATLGRDPVWLTRYNRPLATVAAAQDTIPGLDVADVGTWDEPCDNGACFT
ncbi:phosphoadenosine phosphosulfate reductase [Virgisporangium aurantiacum]|uniref:Phosphoadenosine phosphosulfate reductase n=1 Tax=Virgisporangium aurantiacum TaxID=175570 RepID=A0A8J4DXD6_9ACTN|nr:phosphoadenosine phosphosulfate reductase [Virgisporangium aurantiacum]GIJ53218.1 phosphoadenosine phosphosulfate reductase [Virgisporangium aurantiacum]